MTKPHGLHYPNRIARAFFTAMDDVMGQHGLNTVLTTANLQRYIDHPPPHDLERAFSFADMAAISAALETIYGVRGGRGMALRIGRAAFAMGLKQFGVMRGMGDPAFRALPLTKRVEYGLQALSVLHNNFSDQTTGVRQEKNAYSFYIENSPMAYGRNTEKPVCHAQVGIIQECLRWASNGYVFYVREVTCHAVTGGECVFRINKTAIGESGMI